MVKMGQTATDRLTGFKGIVTARAEYMYGCVRVELTAAKLAEGKPVEPQWFDEQRLEVKPTAKSGGPRQTPQRANDPT